MPSMPITTAPFDRTALSPSIFRMYREYYQVYAALREELTALAQDRTRSVTMAELCAEVLFNFHFAHMAFLKDDILQGNRRWQRQRLASQQSADTRQAQYQERNSQWVLGALDLLQTQPTLGIWTLAGLLVRKFDNTPYQGKQKAIWGVLRDWNVRPPRTPRS